MFFFTSCCQNFQTGQGFQIRKPTINQNIELSFKHKLEDIQKDILNQQTNQIIKIKKSQYEELLYSFKGTNKMWIDHQFPPEKSSLGDIKIQAKWKRVSEIVQNPNIFSGKISPSQIQDQYRQELFQQSSFYCTIAGLSQYKEIIKNLFIGIDYNKAGLYKVPLKIDGQIQEIIIDDFIPIRTNGVPIFSSSVSNQIWLYLLQKVWAKAMEGYSNINNLPCQILKAFTWAPCQQIYMKQSEDQHKKLWEKLLNASSKKYPCLCEILIREQEIDLSDTGLQLEQIYSFLEAITIKDQKGRMHQILKIRSFINIDNLKINIDQDHDLWSLLSETEKGKKYQVLDAKKENIFYIRYQQFCKYFTKITFCLYESQSNYISDTVLSDLKRGFLYKFDVSRDGKYNIQLHQPKIIEQKIEVNNQNIYKRGTIILIKQQNKQLSYVDGILTLADKDSLLSIDLTQGKYLIYAKFDLDQNITLSAQYSISIYSKYFTQIVKIQRFQYPDILQRVFLNYGRQNPRNKHNNDLMWISYRLFYKQGGFAFVAMGNKKQSSKKFLITFDEKDFIKMNFKLKKPYKHIDSIQTLQVLPGQQKIILARCINNTNLKSLKFPPQLGIKIEPVDNK